MVGTSSLSRMDQAAAGLIIVYRDGVLWYVNLGSRHNLRHDAAFHVGQTEVAAGVAEGQPLVIEAEQMQDGRVQVAHVHRLLDGVMAEFVGGAVTQAALNAAAG